MFNKSSAENHVLYDILYNNILGPDTSHRIVYPMCVACFLTEISNHILITRNNYLFSTAKIIA